jgi:hypothetical protein
MKKLVLAVVLCGVAVALAQSPEPKPAFAGQTDAPAAPKSADFDVQIITGPLECSVVGGVLADGSFLVSENDGILAGRKDRWIRVGSH